jgi:hypothetical protein
MALGDGIVRAIETPKNRRDIIPAGTREVSVTLATLGKQRMRVIDRGIAIVTKEYVAKWGEVPWDLASLHFHFVTVQCVVVLEVRP